MQTTESNRLGELIAASGAKRFEIAALCERDTTTIGRWISGEVPIPTDALRSLTEHFGVTVEHLLGWDREPAQVESV
jgi:hypothetical protein